MGEKNTHRITLKLCLFRHVQYRIHQHKLVKKKLLKEEAEEEEDEEEKEDTDIDADTENRTLDVLYELF